MPKAKGFSLIELMVTVAVIAIALTIAVPSFSNSVRSSQLGSASNQLIAALQQARSEAIKRRTTLYVQAGGSTAAWAHGWTVASVATAPGENEGDPDTETITALIQFDLPNSAVSITTPNNNGLTRLGFTRDGELVNRSGANLAQASFTLCVTGQGKGRQINLNRFGRAAVSTTNC